MTKFCYKCTKYRGVEGGQYIVANNKQVKFQCKECRSKVKAVKRIK